MDPCDFSLQFLCFLMRSFAALVLLLTGGLLLGGCGSFGTDGTERLVGPTWQLTALRAPDGTATPVDSLVGRPDTSAAYTLEFGDDGRLGGVADCNRYGAEYVAQEGGSLSVDSLVSTLKGCGEASGEGLYFDELGDAETFDVHDRVLRLHSEGGGTLRFGRGDE